MASNVFKIGKIRKTNSNSSKKYIKSVNTYIVQFIHFHWELEICPITSDSYHWRLPQSWAELSFMQIKSIAVWRLTIGVWTVIHQLIQQLSRDVNQPTAEQIAVSVNVP